MAEQARIAITAEDRFSRVVAGAQTQFQSLRATLGSLAAVGGALSAGAASAWLNSIVNGLDRFNDLRDATGASIGNLSALEDVVTRAGGSFDEVSNTLVRFNQALNSAQPGSDIARTFEALGLSLAQLRQADPAQALLDTSLALRQFTDDGDKARAVQTLFGRSIREVAPLLNDLADAGRLNATVTDEQAKQAEQFKKEVGALNKNALDLSRALVADLLPALNDMFAAFKSAREAGSGLSVVGNAIKVTLQALSVLGANVAFVFQGVGREIGAIAAQLQSLATGNLKAFGAIREALISDNERARAELDAFEKRVLGLGEATQQAAPKVQQVARSIGAVGVAARRSAAELALFRSANEGIAGEFEARQFVLKQQAEELQRLNDLLGRTQTDKLRADLALLDKAFFDGVVSAREYDEALGRLLGKDTAESIKKTEDAAEKLGLTIASSIGRLIETGGSMKDFFRALADDIAKLIIQMTILEPLARNLRELFKGFGGSVGGGVNPVDALFKLFGSAGGGIAAAGAGGAVRAASAGGGLVVNITNNIGSAYGDAALVKAMDDSSRATVARIVDLQSRGRLALAG